MEVNKFSSFAKVQQSPVVYPEMTVVVNTTSSVSHRVAVYLWWGGGGVSIWRPENETQQSTLNNIT